MPKRSSTRASLQRAQLGHAQSRYSILVEETPRRSVSLQRPSSSSQQRPSSAGPQRHPALQKHSQATILTVRLELASTNLKQIIRESLSCVTYQFAMVIDSRSVHPIDEHQAKHQLSNPPLCHLQRMMSSASSARRLVHIIHNWLDSAMSVVCLVEAQSTRLPVLPALVSFANLPATVEVLVLHISASDQPVPISLRSLSEILRLSLPQSSIHSVHPQILYLRFLLHLSHLPVYQLLLFVLESRCLRLLKMPSSNLGSRVRFGKRILERSARSSRISAMKPSIVPPSHPAFQQRLLPLQTEEVWVPQRRLTLSMIMSQCLLEQYVLLPSHRN